MTRFFLPRLRRVSDHTFVENLIDGEGAIVVDLGMNKGAFAREIKQRKPRARCPAIARRPCLHRAS
jgi:hypothetical protein